MKARAKPETIVITGASSGIGQALALCYAGYGITLGLTGRDEKRLRAVQEICTGKGAQAVVAVLDVTDRESMAAWLTEFDKKHSIDLLIANAGISAGTGGVITGEDPAQARRLFEVNLIGVLNSIDPVLPAMQARGKGQVALMSSLAGFRGWPGAPAYCASKAAVKVYGESLRGALGKSGIGISVICPGFVESRMTDANDFSMPFLMSAERAAGIIAKGLEKDKGRIAFPFLAFFMAWFLAALPDVVAQRILKSAPAKAGV